MSSVAKISPIEQEQRKTHAKHLRKNCLKLSMTELFAISGVAVRTIEDYESGRRSVPQRYLDQLQALYERDQEITHNVIAEVKAEIDKRYPHGIPSA